MITSKDKQEAEEFASSLNGPDELDSIRRHNETLCRLATVAQIEPVEVSNEDRLRGAIVEALALIDVSEYCHGNVKRAKTILEKALRHE